MTTLPYGSSTFTTGCCPKVEPAVADPGRVVNASWLAAPGLTVKLSAVGLVSVGPIASFASVMLYVPAASS